MRYFSKTCKQPEHVLPTTAQITAPITYYRAGEKRGREDLSCLTELGHQVAPRSASSPNNPTRDCKAPAGEDDVFAIPNGLPPRSSVSRRDSTGAAAYTHKWVGKVQSAPPNVPLVTIGSSSEPIVAANGDAATAATAAAAAAATDVQMPPVGAP